MALHPLLPRSPYETLDPSHRWFPAPEDLRATAYERLMPPLVARVRSAVQAWRDSGYAGASPTSIALLRWWFETEHPVPGDAAPFRWYFAQREAVESVVWLYDVARARDKFELMRFDASGAVSAGMFPEEWPRYVVKMATGAGKTKVLALLIAWSFYHRLYEAGSALSRNILLIAPNIIVLDRLRTDFDGLRIFFRDPVLPDNGVAGRNWRDDFQLDVHLQDEVRIVRDTGNLFLTNVHRVYARDAVPPSPDDDDLSDYFLGPFGADPCRVGTPGLGERVRELDELAVFNDEAHHIHDERMQWFSSIRDVHHRMLQRGHRLALQLDVTATPRRDNGAIFVQTVADYPLVEAIHQRVVKHPVLPDAESRAHLAVQPSAIFHEKYADYLALGVEEWRKSAAEHRKMGKKAVLFVMVDDTRNCDEVGAHLERTCPELQGGVLVIHTKRNGEIAETASAKDKDELDRLRREAHGIDSDASPYKAIVSVLMLKEGWDVRNVTTIVGLRAFAALSNILPEQTIGRGLRRMYAGADDVPETVSLIGTPAFIEFVEGIQSEGVELDYAPMGRDTVARRADSLVVEVETDNPDKDVDALDIALPRLARRHARAFGRLAGIDAASLPSISLPLKPLAAEETPKEFVFKTLIDGAAHHTVRLDPASAGDARSIVSFFARRLADDLHAGAEYDAVYRLARFFVRERLFAESPVSFDDPRLPASLAAADAARLTYDTLRAAINRHTVVERPAVPALDGHVRLRDVRPLRTQAREAFAARRSLFNRIVGEPNAGGFELRFARFLDEAPGVVAFAKNYLAVGFALDYVKANGELSNYIPDFFVKVEGGSVVMVETKGREELDLPRKMARLAQWCADATAASQAIGGPAYRFLYVDEAGFERHRPASFAELATMCREYQPAA